MLSRWHCEHDRQPERKDHTPLPPERGRGKSTTVINLAAALAMADMRVLVVDTMPRRTALGLGVDRGSFRKSTNDSSFW